MPSARVHMPFTALFHGLRLCLFRSDVRRLSLWPWLIGAVSYCGTLYAAYRLHGWVVSLLVSDPTGVWSWIVYVVAWIAATLLLLGGSFVLSIVLVAVLAGAFQSAVAAAVLRQAALPPPEDASSMLGETSRTIAVELRKMLFILPLMCVALIIGFIPIFVPLAFALTACLLAYQFVDVVLDLFRLPVRERLRFARANALTLFAYGATLTVFWAIPFLGLLLAPAAVAGAAWLLAQEPYRRTLER